MKITTAFCKKALHTYSKQNKDHVKEFKRTAKYKAEGMIIREFSDDTGDTYKVTSNADDTAIVNIMKTGEGGKYGNFAGIMQALSKLDPIFIGWLETQFDLDNCGSFKEYMQSSDGTIFCDMDASLEYAQEHGINMMESKDEDIKGTALVAKHFQECVPSDFPYVIQTEDYVHLWEPEKKGLTVERVEDIPCDKKEMDEWLNGEIARNNMHERTNEEAMQDRLEEFEKIKNIKPVKKGKKVPANKYLFCLFDDAMPENENGFLVLITPVLYWKKTKAMCSSYTEKQYEEINAVCDEIGMCEEMESHYDFACKITKEEARELLLARGFCEDDEFTKQMSKDRSGESSSLCEIDFIECCVDGDKQACFMVCTENGTICVDEKGIVLHGEVGGVGEGDHVSEFPGKGIYIDHVLGECGTCEDETSIRIHFKDGHSTTNEEEAFFRAFGLKPTQSPKQIKEAVEYAKECEERLARRTPEEVYVDEHIDEVQAKIKIMPEFNVAWLLSKYLRGYKGVLGLSKVKLFDGREVILASEYLKAYLIAERKYELVKEVMELKW